MLLRIRLAGVVASVLIALALAVRGSIPGLAQQAGQPPPISQELMFDIPAQPLATALGVYGATSGVQVLYESDLAANKMSVAIKGTFAPEAALRALLVGTGLVGRRTDVDAITVTPELRERSASAAPIAPDARFLGALQTGILDVLCRNSETRPGSYRMALQLWVTPAGILRHASLLGSTGNLRRDEALVLQLRDLRVAALPPPGLAQPITLAIVPRSPLQPSECTER